MGLLFYSLQTICDDWRIVATTIATKNLILEMSFSKDEVCFFTCSMQR